MIFFEAYKDRSMLISFCSSQIGRWAMADTRFWGEIPPEETLSVKCEDFLNKLIVSDLETA